MESNSNTHQSSSPSVGSGDPSEKGQDGFPITHVGNDEDDDGFPTKNFWNDREDKSCWE